MKKTPASLRSDPRPLAPDWVAYLTGIRSQSGMAQVRNRWLTQRRAELPSAATRRCIPAHEENKHEAGHTNKLPAAQESKEPPGYDKMHCGQEIIGRCPVPELDNLQMI